MSQENEVISWSTRNLTCIETASFNNPGTLMELKILKLVRNTFDTLYPFKESEIVRVTKENQH